MISDVLSDAIDLIREYLVDYPEYYWGKQDDIERVVNEMDQLRGELGAPPHEEER